VPTVALAQIYGATDLRLLGGGFTEGSGLAVTVNGVVIADPGPSTGMDVWEQFLSNDTLRVTTSAALTAGQVVTVSTAGGSSAPVLVALDDPSGVASLYDLALFPVTAGADAGRFVTVDTNTFALRVLEPTTLATVRTITRPGASTGQLGLAFLGAGVTVGGVVVPTGSLAVVNGGDAPDRLYYLDPAGTGTVLASVALGGQPLVDEAGGFAVSYHAGRGTFFVLRHGTDLLTEIDPATGAALRSAHGSACSKWIRPAAGCWAPTIRSATLSSVRWTCARRG
jgi:hypothetical protein